jgi:hypothetical protein
MKGTMGAWGIGAAAVLAAGAIDHAAVAWMLCGIIGALVYAAFAWAVCAIMARV